MIDLDALLQHEKEAVTELHAFIEELRERVVAKGLADLVGKVVRIEPAATWDRGLCFTEGKVDDVSFFSDEWGVFNCRVDVRPLHTDGLGPTSVYLSDILEVLEG